ncbi:hypothetical protein ACGFIV_29180 [Sphaerisporangium sp. NPDC049003]|uniref:hypothetical protein n=1 Tax=Sphaerisporangium sp. NPDC049003 TaxID=3364517 RepID=UPI00371909C5
MGRRRYVARGVPGGYRIWDNKVRRWWGDLYELCPDDLLDELNGARDYDKITTLLKRYRAMKRLAAHPHRKTRCQILTAARTVK